MKRGLNRDKESFYSTRERRCNLHIHCKLLPHKKDISMNLLEPNKLAPLPNGDYLGINKHFEFYVDSIKCLWSSSSIDSYSGLASVLLRCMSICFTLHYWLVLLVISVEVARVVLTRATHFRQIHKITWRSEMSGVFKHLGKDLCSHIMNIWLKNAFNCIFLEHIWLIINGSRMRKT